MTRPWQIRLVVDPIAERAFGLALETVAQSIASFETAPGGRPRSRACRAR